MRPRPAFLLVISAIALILASCGDDSIYMNPVGEGCFDGQQSGEQTDIDCGGPECEPCGVGQGCDSHGDCDSHFCFDGICQPSVCDGFSCSLDDATCTNGACVCTGGDDESDGDEDGEDDDTTLDEEDIADIDCPALIIDTLAVEDVDTHSANFSGKIHEATTHEPEDRGFCWSTDDEPSADDDCHWFGHARFTGEFDHTTEALMPGTTYHVRTVVELDQETTGQEERYVYAEPIEFTTDAPPPTDLSATEGQYAEHVEVTWEGVEGADEYRVFRDGEAIGTSESTTYEDTEASEPDVLEPPGGLTATQGDYEDRVEVSWSGVDVDETDAHDYAVTAVYPDVETSQTDEDTGWRAHADLEEYIVYRDGTEIGSVDASTITFVDDGADIGIIEEQPTVTASEGEYADRVAIEWDEPETGPGSPHSYTVESVADIADGNVSDPVDGWTNSPSIDGYRIYRDSDEVGTTDETTFYFEDDGAATGPIDEAPIVEASEGDHPDRVDLEWNEPGTGPGLTHGYTVEAFSELTDSTESDPADGWTAGPPVDGYRIYRDGDEIGSVDASTLTFSDDEADAGVLTESPSLTATEGDYADRVELEWTEPATDPGSTHSYTVEAFADLTDSSTSDPDDGWRQAPGVDGYEVFRDGSSIDTVTSTSYSDEGAEVSGPPDAPSLEATSGTHTDRVTLEWNEPGVVEGVEHTYEVIAATGFGSEQTSNDAQGWYGEPQIDSYEIEIDGGNWISVGDTTTHDDFDADSPTLDPGEAAASKGSHDNHVAVNLNNEATSAGDPSTYRVRAVSSHGTSDASNSADGHIGVGSPQIVEWQRSANPYEDDNYSQLADTTGSSFQDDEFSGRYYRAVVDADGVSQQISDPDYGYFDNVIEISDCDELQAMNDNLQTDHVLIDDIDCGDTSDWNGGDGFEPIGTSSNPFEGNFDGQTHVINDLYIDRGDETRVGLFGKVNDNMVRRVGVEDAWVRGGMFTGILIGRCDYGDDCDAEQVYTTGYIECTNNSRGESGGVFGDYRQGTIRNAYSWAHVEAGGSDMGGLIGDNNNQMDTRYTYTAGTIDSPNGDSGNLAGENDGEIRDSYCRTDGGGAACVDVGNGSETNVNALDPSDMQGSQAAQNMSALDFQDIWATQEDGYPVFQWQLDDD